MAGKKRGKLGLYLGYAAGVGKTYKMLMDAQGLRAAGVDVVVGYFEPHGREETIAKSKGLESVRRKRIAYRGLLFEEMDTDAVLARNPAVCLVDELAHSNVPGSERSKRWEDVEKLLDAGIDVLATLNIQHLESLNDQVWQVSSVRVRETIPDWIVEKADEILLVDLTPEALLNRLQRGVVYKPEEAKRALENFFRESTLVALRELALRQAAHEVEHRIVKEEAPDLAVKNASAAPHKENRILILITANPRTAMLIRRAKRVSAFLGAECFAVTVQPKGDLSGLPPDQRETIERHLNFARNLHIETRILEGEDVASILVDFGRRNRISQIFITRPGRRSLLPALSRDPAQKIVDLAEDMQVVIVSNREPVAH